ncbi:molybdenum cofactor biosynthesis protein MoaE [Salibaculum halophilum]|uniref:molybdenum cofactor biosynthesis protein MoaE n=1 Tax=Salibaculum halophilum TaxID=1914408 RepID=UPI000A122216|nr:molybdenum cofactor biosynthesis protein MoaE [Salibaculum halophilum]
MTVRVHSDAFDPGAEVNAFTAAADGAGAVVSFSGLVRDVAGGLQAMEIEHYPGMTEKALAEIRDAAVRRWRLTGALIVHRHGVLAPGEVIMMVATAARHRRDAFEAAEFLMDYLKSRAPFWKKERTDAGAAWVAARDDDEDALSRW